MLAISDRLKQFATVMADPTRGLILVELDQNGEATATQLAARLGLTPNALYHQMRLLVEAGVVDPPRAVPGDTYVEKFYSINPEVRAALRLDPWWYDRVKADLSIEDRQAMVVSHCLMMAHLLRRVARAYAAADAEALDAYMGINGPLLLSNKRVSRKELAFRCAGIREMLESSEREFAEDLDSRSDLVLIATLPGLGDRNGSAEH
jgi:DNA-binding transcriptional ArsR family regulator